MYSLDGVSFFRGELFDFSIPLPDFMTSAKRELMPSAVFLVFFVGAIVAGSRCYC